MPSEAVQPLRINKNTPSSSPSKMASSPYRPLSEISPMERRRNSPSYNQATKSMMFARENSPFDSSPWSKNRASSPRAFWQERDPTSPSRFASSENAFNDEASMSPRRRASIENLKKVSRVKNSSMFEREQQHQYDPASPQLDRPTATGRPLSVAVHGNAFNGQGLDGLRKNNGEIRGHRRGQSQTKIPILSSPSSDQSAPMSDISGFDPDNSALSEGASDVKEPTPRPLRRQPKSVTFDSGPPEINEYEMATPDPSSVASGSRQGSYESDDEEYDYEVYDPEGNADNDSFDASLEDTEKTPVVLPEDWRHMSPDNANSELARNFEDPFDARNGSPSPSAKATSARPAAARTESARSDNERPLPALPPGLRDSPSRGLSATAERIGSNPRSLPSPPRPACVSKEEILGMQKRASMSIDDRLRLMGIQDTESNQSSPPGDRAARAAKLQAAHNKDRGLGIQIHEDATAGSEDKGDEYVPSISRESIMKKMKTQPGENPYDGSGYGDDLDYANLDPDVPIPSREASSNFDDVPHDNPVKQEDQDSEFDVYDIPDMYSPERSPSRLDNHERDGSVVRRSSNGSDGHKNSSSEDDGPPTPKADDFALAQAKSPLLSNPQQNNGDTRNSSNSLPEFENMDDDFKSGLASFMSQDEAMPEQKKAEDVTAAIPKLEAIQPFLQRPSTPLSDLKKSRSSFESNSSEEDPGSPGSVIHRSSFERKEKAEPVFIPERLASIKAPGSKLKARPSLSVADADSMAAQRRRVSGGDPPHIPPIPKKSPRRQSSVGVSQDSLEELGSSQMRKSSLQKIELEGLKSQEDFGLSLELGEEFDRVIEAQKKGYLMRQNTKVVVARARDFSDEKAPPTSFDPNVRGTRSAGPSPRKASGQAKPWTTEQWNGKERRKSIRTASGSRKHVPATGPAPPLPGQESNVNGSTDEVSTRDSYEECEWEEGAERGRLFVKVIGVKDLDLPLPKHERTQFQLTLDNGLHCVTTSWLELSQSAPIGQEFELVVLNDLEFQLTLQTKLTPPPQPAKPHSAASSPTKSAMNHINHMKKKSFSHLLMSPKKRKEAEARRLAEEQDQREREAAAAALAHHRATPVKPQVLSAWDLLHDLVAPDGSFARAYISLKSFEESCYGKALSVEVPCYNEWAEEHDPDVIESMRSKRGNRGGDVVRRPPYQVGNLQLMLLYVPKPKGARDEDMPRSLNGAVREMDRAREAIEKKWEGCLSQQGGDCPYWRRRFFRLVGTKLTAFHESTRQPRATINLAKAVKLIDDKTSLISDAGSSGKKGGRRKSGFSEEEEGYMFVEEGFRIRFANGETIDFYADNAAQKADWMRALADVIGCGKPGLNGAGAGADAAGRRAWTELVLRREQRHGFAMRRPLPSGTVRRRDMRNPQLELERPSSEQGQKRSMLDGGVNRMSMMEMGRRGGGNGMAMAPAPPPPVEKDLSPNKAARMRVAMGQAERRAKTKSMMF